MAKIPTKCEGDLLANLDNRMASRHEPPNLFKLIEQRKPELFTALILKGFRAAARKAVVDRLTRNADAFEQASPRSAANPVMRVFARLARAWRLSKKEQVLLLGLNSADELALLMTSQTPDLSIGIIERVAMFLDTSEAINSLLPVPERADLWLRAGNAAILLGERAPLDLMMESLNGIKLVRQCLWSEIRSTS